MKNYLVYIFAMSIFVLMASCSPTKSIHTDVLELPISTAAQTPTTISQTVPDAVNTATPTLEKTDPADGETQAVIPGKLEPALVERLRTIDDTERIAVVIWVAGEPERSKQELNAILAAKYPEVQAALESSGNPFDVGDYDLMMTIKRDYLSMMNEDYYQLVLPAVEKLESWGYEVEVPEGIPNVFATLPKSAILKLTPEPWVGQIYLVEGVVEVEKE